MLLVAQSLHNTSYEIKIVCGQETLPLLTNTAKFFIGYAPFAKDLKTSYQTNVKISIYCLVYAATTVPLVLETI